MDCVAPDGTAVVAYWAQLAWGLLRLRYAATLVRRNDVVREATTLFPAREPRLEPAGIAWSCGRLRLRGNWVILGKPLQRTLLTSDRGDVEWDCHGPKAQARVVFADGVTVEGLGYVEHLRMTLRPWHLPIRELRWGRFLSDGAGVVWIEWRGERPLSLLAVNGTPTDGVRVADTGVAWSGGRVELETGSVLREGSLGATALARVPLLKFLAPRAVRDVHEHKRLSRGRLLGENGLIGTGWAIHEVVRFGGHGG
jgi:hypothetical protein